jgi:hypothetical protein
MTSLIFNVETGRIYDETNPHALDVPTIVDCVRQICLAFKKVELPCTPEREAAALENFVAIEQSFEMFSVSSKDREFFSSVSFVLWSDMLRNICVNELSPRHGPGATADFRSGNQKYRWQYWTERLEPYFPIIDNGYSISAVEDGWLEEVTFLSPDQELPVRVTPVPKTLKGPRIIAIEPCCMQYTQQGIRDALYKCIEESRFASGHVNFGDQSINQDLAIRSSRDGRLATIDLSDASDRVPRDLALDMFSTNPDLRGAIEACRSRYAKLPDGRICGPLEKFASMGSALCFPIEAMYFYTICVASLLELHNLPVTARNVYDVSRDVYVYGDDIVVPTTDADFVLDYLQKYNCKVNTAKTFLTGKFRESCGVDAYDGQCVSPVYVTKPQPKNMQQVDGLVSWISLGNLLYKKGLWRSSSYVFYTLEKILGPLPYVSETSPGLGRISYLGYRSIERWNDRLHRFEVRSMTVQPVYRTDSLDGYAALQKSFLNLNLLNSEGSDSRDAHHLERSAWRGAIALKRRWIPAL